MSTYSHYFERNRALWNAKTSHHVDSEFYDMKGFRQHKNSLREIELAELGEVSGKSLLHLQCHFGQDTLSWANLGAEATGIDLSDEAIATARSLSEELQIPAEFICSNVYDLPEVLDKQYDIVFTSYGVIGWLPDMDKWASILTRYLKPGGTFYMVEFHPFIWTLDDEFKGFAYDYFNKPEAPIHETVKGTYADREAPIEMDEYSWNHALGEVITALVKQGLSLEFLHEFPFSAYNCFPNMKSVGKHRWVFEHLDIAIPYLYSIKATKA